MNRTILICIIAIVLVAVLTIIILIRRSNKKRYKRLQENIDKMKKQKNQDIDDRITLSRKNEMLDDHFELLKKVEPKIETLDTEANLEEDENDNIDEILNVNQGIQTQQVPPTAPAGHSMQKVKKTPRVDDFEKFMDEHAYSRKILGKDLRNKMKGLSPQVKALILTSVLNKFDDDKN